ncbi:MAG: GAF domain-containing sensor histidine kinase [Acidimicrobiales bacterium]
MDRLLPVIAGLNAELDHDVVLGRICRASVDLLDADASAFLTFDGGEAVIRAGVGFAAHAIGTTVPLDDEAFVVLAANPQRILLGDARRELLHRPEALAVLGARDTLAIIPVLARGQLVGALAVAFAQADHRLRSEQWAVLDLLAGHGGAAIANALAFEEAVRRQAHEKAVIDAVADGVITLDGYGLVVSWNRTASELTGLEPAQMAGRPLPFPVGRVDDPVEHRFTDDRWLEIVATPLEVGQVVVLRDISRQKALDSAKAMFVAATSHELKTPLTVIKSFADWLRDNGETADSVRRKTAYDAIADSADELYQIVEKVLLTAKTEAGRIDLSPQSLDPYRVVQAAAGPFDFPGRHHRVTVEATEALPSVWADQKAVRTALGQLLENAVKYSPDGGVITVSATLAPPVGPAGTAAVRFAVRDQGIGLAPGEEDYLFMPFYQGETRSRSGVRGGVGLGLSIVRRLIEAQGGQVGALGAPGQGSEFWFTLPVADTAGAAAEFS